MNKQRIRMAKKLIAQAEVLINSNKPSRSRRAVRASNRRNGSSLVKAKLGLVSVDDFEDDYFDEAGDITNKGMEFAQQEADRLVNMSNNQEVIDWVIGSNEFNDFMKKAKLSMFNSYESDIIEEMIESRN